MQDIRAKFDPRMYEELEIVQERSIGSEMTYKNSLVETETGKSTAKNEHSTLNDDTRGSKKPLFMKTANFGSEKPLTNKNLGFQEEKAYSETISKLEERISSKNNLISQLKAYQIQLADAYDKLKSENAELKSKIKSMGSKYSENGTVSKEKIAKYKRETNYELVSKELESLLGKCNDLSSENEKLISEKEFLKEKLSSAKEEIDFLSNQLVSPHEKTAAKDSRSELSRLTERVKILESENSRLKQSMKFPSSEFSSNRVSHGPDEFSNTKSLRKQEFNSQKHRKFSEACCNLMINCFPKDFDHEKPSLKQVWRWIKGVLEDFVTLNKVFGELQDMLGVNTVAEVMFTVEKLTE